MKEEVIHFDGGIGLGEGMCKETVSGKVAIELGLEGLRENTG